MEESSGALRNVEKSFAISLDDIRVAQSCGFTVEFLGNGEILKIFISIVLNGTKRNAAKEQEVKVDDINWPQPTTRHFKHVNK